MTTPNVSHWATEWGVEDRWFARLSIALRRAIKAGVGKESSDFAVLDAQSGAALMTAFLRERSFGFPLPRTLALPARGEVG